MTAERELERLAVANEVFMTACNLFVLDARFGEMQMNYRLADHADPQRLGDVTGKYVKRAVGYLHIRENGTAQALSELPEDVSSDDVVVDELDPSSATPLQDRLRAIARSLRTGESQDAEIEALANAIDACLDACRPDSGERWLEQIAQWTRSEVLEAEGPGDARDMAARARRLLDRLHQLAQDLQGGPRGDGKTVGGVLALRALLLARATRARNPEDEADALIESLLYVAFHGPARVEHVATGLCARMARQGHRDAIREAAETLKADGDARIERALDGAPLTFYASLYPAAAYELAVVQLGQATAEATADPDEKRRWAKLAVNAEERAVRVATALGFAIMNLDGAWIARHQRQVREVREKLGDDAARFEAQNLIVNLLFYPKALMPLLLGEPSPPDGQLQRP